MKKLVHLIALMMCITWGAMAQNKVTGVVNDTQGSPLPGASVKIKGSSAGTMTDGMGKFTITASPDAILSITYTGFISQEIAIAGKSSVSVSLAEDSKVLGEVVVTALGVKKERKALGYSVTEVKGDELTQARENNVANSLVGKVAGLNVNAVSGGVGSSTNVLIRGVSSISQSNQPLYVINGVPMSNETVGIKDTYSNAPDMGDAIGNLNPDDIASISVLKGAAASALYGSRAKAGVILITTKSGSGKGSIEFNSNYVAEQVINPTDWQYVYGSGSNGNKPTTQAGAFDAGNYSYGAKLDGSDVIQYDGVARPYVAQKNNLEDFYSTGGTFTNTLAFSKGFEGGGVRFSASNLNNNSIVPNSGLDRQSFNLSANFTPVKRLTVDARANYILEQAQNRPILNDGAGNANFQAFFLPTSVDINTLKPGTKADGVSELSFTNNTYATNPWFAAEKFINNTNRKRLITSATARYTFDNGFFVQGRAGRDAYTNQNKSVVPNGTAYLPNGSLSETVIDFSDINTDVLLGKTFQASSDLSITPNIGGSFREVASTNYVQAGSNFNIPGTYQISNTKSSGSNIIPSKYQNYSVYGTLEFAYKNYLYLTGSGRNDWFSTLATPGATPKLDVFYPSVSGSFVFSELTNTNWLTFGKLRAGYAVVGQATNPYQTLLNYGIGLTDNSTGQLVTSINGYTLGSVLNVDIPNSGLRPSKATELEIGTEMKFLNNRLGIDLTWYNKKSDDEIVSAPASITSGYNGVVLNIGRLQNKGVELLLTGAPVKTKDFNWNASLNGSYNDSKVLELAAAQSSILVAQSRTLNANVSNVVGKAANQILAYDYQRDANGVIMKDDNGVPLRGDLKPYGSGYAKVTAGFNNEFNYKNFNLSFLIDGKFGGKVYAATDYYGYIFGLHKATLENRDEKFGTNQVSSQIYYNNLANNVSSLFVQDASFIKFRQMTFGYTFPTKMFNNKIQSMSLNFVARNLFIIMKKTYNIDPEAAFSNVAQGLELGGVPPVRTFGLNLNVKF